MALLSRYLSRIDLYILRQVLVATVIVTISLSAIIWLAQSLRFIDVIVNRGVSVGTFFYLAALIIPNLLSILLPIAIFASVLFVYHRLSVDSEMAVLRSGGLSPAQLAKPALMVALALTIFGYVNSFYLLPVSFKNLRDLQFQLRQDYSGTMLEEGVFTEIVRGVTVFIHDRSRDGTLHGILVHDARDKDTTSTVIAKSGQMLKGPNGLYFIVKEGNRQETSITAEGQKPKRSILYFDSYSLDLSELASAADTRVRQPVEMFLPELLFPSPALNDAERRRYTAEAHQRILSPMLTIVFTLLALASLLTGEMGRRGHFRRLIAAIMVMIMVEAINLALYNMMSQRPGTVILAYLAVFVPLLITAYSLFVTVRSPSSQIS
ncbi:MAG: LPS export ABC transporter permease LptF [Dongiaceae bacterium]